MRFGFPKSRRYCRQAPRKRKCWLGHPRDLGERGFRRSTRATWRSRGGRAYLGDRQRCDFGGATKRGNEVTGRTLARRPRSAPCATALEASEGTSRWRGPTWMPRALTVWSERCFARHLLETRRAEERPASRRSMHFAAAGLCGNASAAAPRAAPAPGVLPMPTARVRSALRTRLRTIASKARRCGCNH